ncbi:MAG: hypothetical protein HRT72_05040 [Flavobacteriales bacterium]|nr:hypothetical protein [Flavobacteriales bacterium]
MKHILLISLLALLVTACHEEQASRKRIISDCTKTVQQVGNVDEILAHRYCRCVADTLITVFSDIDIDKHLILGDEDRYELYKSHTKHCMIKLANPAKDMSVKE